MTSQLLANHLCTNFLTYRTGFSPRSIQNGTKYIWQGCYAFPKYTVYAPTNPKVCILLTDVGAPKGNTFAFNVISSSSLAETGVQN